MQGEPALSYAVIRARRRDRPAKVTGRTQYSGCYVCREDVPKEKMTKVLDVWICASCRKEIWPAGE